MPNGGLCKLSHRNCLAWYSGRDLYQDLLERLSALINATFWSTYALISHYTMGFLPSRPLLQKRRTRTQREREEGGEECQTKQHKKYPIWIFLWRGKPSFSRHNARTGVQKLISWNVLGPVSCKHPMCYESTISRTSDAGQPRRTFDNLGLKYSGLPWTITPPWKTGARD